MSAAKTRAANLLTFYLRQVYEHVGLGWEADNDSEVEQLVDAIGEMVADDVRAHAEDAPHRYQDGSSY